jgi:5-methylcytosine-specific restriction enzyme subunit McrC
LKADATVGVLLLDRIRLVLEPKFAIPDGQLMRWLAYALGAPVPHPATTRRWATDHYGYADLVAAALLVECQQLLSDGLRRDYVRNPSCADGWTPLPRPRAGTGNSTSST